MQKLLLGIISPIPLAAILLMPVNSEGASAVKISAPRIEVNKSQPHQLGRLILDKELEIMLKNFRYKSFLYTDFSLHDDNDFPSTVRNLYLGEYQDDQSTPMTVLGDFNGDGVKDIALYGKATINDTGKKKSKGKKYEVVIALLSNNGIYRPVEVWRGKSEVSTSQIPTVYISQGVQAGQQVTLQIEQASAHGRVEDGIVIPFIYDKNRDRFSEFSGS